MLPYVVMCVVGAVDIVAGPDLAFMQLLSLGPAFAAVSGTVRRTIVIGIAALALCEFLAFYNQILGSQRNNLALATVLGVTVASTVAAAGRRQRERELAGVRIVAEVAQRVLLRPIPRVVGPVRMAMRYVSATAEARIGGDLYEVVTTPTAVRLIIGDVQGKGLGAVETAAMLVGAFREAAFDAVDLTAVAARLEGALARNAGVAPNADRERFATAVLVEIHPESDEIELLNCGHPPPLLTGVGTTSLLEPRVTGLPLGLSEIAEGSRLAQTVRFPHGYRLLLYTDGISEARDHAGDFFPLTERSKMLADGDVEDALDRLKSNVLQHVGGKLGDDAAMLLLQRHRPRQEVAADLSHTSRTGGMRTALPSAHTGDGLTS
jgi:serine phosphatase RsbU (regulator of sigma subunit)